MDGPEERRARAAAERLATLVGAVADESEERRRLAPAVVEALAEAGLFALCVPRSLGGGEADPLAMIAAVEEIARADGAAGWCLMIGATTGLIGGYLAEEGAREVFADPRVVTGGVLAPHGRAVAVEGGYRASGRWAFGSGCQHSAWLIAGCAVVDGDRPRRHADGTPELVSLVFPAEDVVIHDTWNVAGLRGTGSHDFEVRDVFVPEARTLAAPSPQARESGPLYAFPLYGALALGIAAVALGIARAAIDELCALAVRKTPSASRRSLAERALVQADVAEAEALHGAARAFLRESVAVAYATAEQNQPLTIAERARLRLASTHAVRGAARAVGLMYEAGGGTSIYASSRLQRCFRDVHVVTQHTMIGRPTLEVYGRVRLGLDTDLSMF